MAATLSFEYAVIVVKAVATIAFSMLCGMSCKSSSYDIFLAKFKYLQNIIMIEWLLSSLDLH